MIRKFNIIVYNFARNIRRISRTSNTEVENIGDRQKYINIKQNQKQQIQQDYEQQIQPLSYDRQVQQSLKTKVAETFKYNYEGQDPSPHKLVHRPSKGAAWGLGGQLMLASKKVQLQGLKAQTDDIVQFLQLHQCKNIYVHDFFAQNQDKRDNNRRRYHIIGSCFSSKHCWKTGIQLKNSFNLNSGKTKLKRRIKYDPIFAMLHGGKDQQWTMVTYKDYEVSLMTEQQRQTMDLQWKWNNPVSDEIIDKHLEMKLMKKGRKRQFEDLD